MKKSGFTLTETLVMIGVIGIIAVITIVSLVSKKPDQDAIMLQKAYKSLSEAVASLANNEDLYPLAVSFMSSKSTVSAFTPISLDKFQDEKKFDPSSSCLSTVTSSASGSSWASLTNTFCSSGVGGDCSSQSEAQFACHAAAMAEMKQDCLANGGTWVDTSATMGKNCGKCSGGNTSTSSTSSSSSSGSSNGNTIPDEITGSTMINGIYAVNPDGTVMEPGSGIDGASNGYQKIDRYQVFLNTNLPANASNPKYTAANKFAYNFGTMFVETPETTSNNVVSFKTKDGINWTVTDNFATASQNAFIDVRLKENGTSYRFTVDSSGKITPDGNAAKLLQKAN